MSEHKKVNVLRGRKISIDNAKLIGTGAMGKVYLLEDDNVVKVMNSTDVLESEREIQLSKWAFSKGLPTAISYDVVDVDGHPGLVYESLGRGNLRNELRDKPDEFIPIMQRYLELIKTVNSITAENGQLPSAKEQFLKRIERTAAYFTSDEFGRIKELVSAIPEDNHLIHGDCHIKNVKVLGDALFLIDLDTLSVGNPIFEFMGLCCCYTAYYNTDENGYNFFFEIDDAIVKRAYYYIVDNYFDIGEDDKKKNAEKIELISYASMLYQLNPVDDKVCFDDMLARVKSRLYSVENLILKMK